jgi:hypothetical protein
VTPSAPQPGRLPWIGLAAIAALALGIGVAYWQSRAPGPGVPVAPGDAPEEAIRQALRQAGPGPGAPEAVDSTALKQHWIEEVRGVDLSGLDTTRRELFLRFANAGRCTCGCGYTLAGCRASDMTCEESGRRLEALLDSIRAGFITSARGIRTRPR